MTNVKTMTPPDAATAVSGQVYCPICTHTVSAQVVFGRNAVGKRIAKSVPGQKCPRCSAPLDAAFVIRTLQAA
jgi:uncharacterized protein (UPF0212 family)